MSRIGAIILSVLLISFISFLSTSIAYCSRGGATGYKNHIDVIEYDGNYRLCGKDNLKSEAVEVYSILFECKFEGRGCKKESMTFYIDARNEDGSGAILNTFNEIVFSLTEEDIYDYLAMTGRNMGRISSYKLIDISFSSYTLKSDNFVTIPYEFDPSDLRG